MSWNALSTRMDPDVPGSASDFYQTPNLERLAEAGMRFTDAYCAAPICTPTRAALITGKSPAQLQTTEILFYPEPRWHDGLPLTPPVSTAISPDEITLPERIKQADPSYVTAAFGKWHLSRSGCCSEADMGFDYFGSQDSGPNDPKSIFGLTQLATDFVEARVAADEPFYLQLNHFAVHDPHQARQETIEKYQALPPGSTHKDPLYAAMVEDLDTGIGRLLDKIEDLGIQDNTYVIFTSDNGAPKNTSSSKPLFSGKATIWEGGIRVPLIVSGPGVAPGSISRVPATTVDLYATVSDLVGNTTSLPQGVEGASLVPILENGGNLPDGMDYLVREHAEDGALYFHSPHNFGPVPGSRVRPSSAIRQGDYKLLKVYGEYGKPDEIYLFNLVDNLAGDTSLSESDVLSSSLNLADDMPELAAELLGKLDNWLESVDAPQAYDVLAPVELVWDARTAGNVPNGWRSTTDTNYRARETWDLAQGVPTSSTPKPEWQRPVLQQTVAAHQPGLAEVAFHFDGDDGMSRKFFHVSNDRNPVVTVNRAIADFDRSTAIEFWIRFDELNREQIIFESGSQTQGISLTLGDGDNDNQFDELRFRANGSAGNSIVATADIDQFANPTRDFIHVVAVLNDDPTDRYAAIFVNGAEMAHVEGLPGEENSIHWDGYDSAGLGRTIGSLGAASGSGELPFDGGNLAGDISQVRFHNYSVNAPYVQSKYNAMLHHVDFGILHTSGDVTSPIARPSNVGSSGLKSDDSIWVMMERQDVLDQFLAVDIEPQGGTAFELGPDHLLPGGTLAAGTEFTSYLLHFAPEGGSDDHSAVGTVTFYNPIQAILVGGSSLALTDSLLGTIGIYPDGQRSLDAAGEGLLSISEDRHTLSLSLTAASHDIIQLRILTMADPDFLGGDYNNDGRVSAADFTIWQETMGSRTDLRADGNDNGLVDPGDFAVWKQNFGRSIDPVIVHVGDYNYDGLINAADFTIWRDTFGSTTDLRADGNGNGRVGPADLAVWKETYGQTFEPQMELVGDYNNDGRVNAADFTIWRDTLGSTTDLRADGNGNRKIDPDDFNVWKRNYGHTSNEELANSSQSAHVPEPSTFALLLNVILLGYTARIRRGATR